MVKEGPELTKSREIEKGKATGTGAARNGDSRGESCRVSSVECRRGPQQEREEGSWRVEANEIEGTSVQVPRTNPRQGNTAAAAAAAAQRWRESTVSGRQKPHTSSLSVVDARKKELGEEQRSKVANSKTTFPKSWAPSKCHTPDYTTDDPREPLTSNVVRYLELARACKCDQPKGKYTIHRYWSSYGYSTSLYCTVQYNPVIKTGPKAECQHNPSNLTLLHTQGASGNGTVLYGLRSSGTSHLVPPSIVIAELDCTVQYSTKMLQQVTFGPRGWARQQPLLPKRDRARFRSPNPGKQSDGVATRSNGWAPPRVLGRVRRRKRA
ncbi:hypothetical protein B7463_g1985, partial [Scytalidium lignicola]